MEHWTSASGGTGTSYNYFDTHEQQWNQLWVDAQGNHAHFAGVYRDEAMRFEGRWVKYDGTPSLMTITFTPQGNGRVRQYIEQSTDDGKSYVVWFDGYYSRTSE